MSSIYQELILDHYHHPRNFGDMKGADKEVSAVNTICGDKIVMKVKMDNDGISDIKFSGSGCAISLASASMLTDYAKGKSVSQLQKLDMSFILKMLGIELSPNRLKCALLPLEALHKLLKK